MTNIKLSSTLISELMKSRSPKSDQIFKPSQHYNRWIVMWFKRGCRQAFSFFFFFLSKFENFSAGVTLKMRSRSPKSNYFYVSASLVKIHTGERGGSVVECRTPEREVGGSKPTPAVLCPWARHFTPRKYWLITQEAVAPSRHDWKIVDWDVEPQHKQTKSTHQRK